MKAEWLTLLWMSGLFLTLFGVCEFLYHFAKIKVELTRKLSHTGTGLLTMLFPIVFLNPLSVLIICFSFLILLTISLKFNFLKSINAIERKSYGSILYPITVVLVYYFYDYKSGGKTGEEAKAFYFYFYLPVLIMAIADPLATLVGKATQWKPYSVFDETKSLSGSIAFFVVALILSFLFLGIENWSFILLIALLSAIVEAISIKGFDNFSIPFSVMLVLYFI